MERSKQDKTCTVDFFCLSPVLISTSLETFMRIYAQICVICNINMATLAKHFLSWVKRTAFPEPGLHTRAISLRHKGYRSQFFFLEPILWENRRKKKKHHHTATLLLCFKVGLMPRLPCAFLLSCDINFWLQSTSKCWTAKALKNPTHTLIPFNIYIQETNLLVLMVTVPLAKWHISDDNINRAGPYW